MRVCVVAAVLIVLLLAYVLPAHAQQTPPLTGASTNRIVSGLEPVADSPASRGMGRLGLQEDNSSRAVAATKIYLPSLSKGVPGYALQFDGVDDFVSIADTGAFDFDYTFTVEAWVKPLSFAGAGDYKAILTGGAAEPPHAGGAWTMAVGDGNYSNWMLSVCVPGCTSASSGPGGLLLGQWQHLAATYDGSTITLYRNGLQIASAPHSGNVNNVTYLLVGIWKESFNGLIDEVRIWNVARSARGIQGNMSHLLSGNEPGLVGYWRFDEGSGQTVLDRSTSHSNGRLGFSPATDGADPVWVPSSVPVY